MTTNEHPLIKKISKIDNFGIFSNFNWDQSLEYVNKARKDHLSKVYEFKKINILYGRNYSGKTSLSKIIRSLEMKATPIKYENPQFEIQLSNEDIINQNKLQNFKCPIFVYNSDFVKENLGFFESESQKIKSFSVALGHENKQILEKIDDLKRTLGSKEEGQGIYVKIDKLKEKRSSKENDRLQKNNDLEKLLKNKSTDCRSTSIRHQSNLYGDSYYDVRKFRADIDVVSNETFKPISESEKQDYLLIIQQSKELDEPKIDFSNCVISISDKIEAFREKLNSQVGKSSKIEELIENSSLNSWVEKGLSLHDSKTHCAFCSNEISESRLNTLRQHFDEESKLAKENLKKIIEKLTEKKEKASNITLDMNEFYPQYHNELFPLKQILIYNLNKQKQAIESLISQFEYKKDNLFNSVEYQDVEVVEDSIKETIAKIVEIKNKHVRHTLSLDTKLKNAQKELKEHEIFYFLKSINYEEKKAAIERLNLDIESDIRNIKLLENEEKKILREIADEESKLSSETEACNSINKILNHNFGHTELQLKSFKRTHEIRKHEGGNRENKVFVDPLDNKVEVYFEIQRNGGKAHNLSEGEISLISFCYFMAKLIDKIKSKEKPIIWIDDPICSLDANHIFFVFSLIDNYICQDKEGYTQLFISTHSLDFLKYLRRIKGAVKDNELKDDIENKDISYFLIKRFEKHSDIQKMPTYLSKFLTEFNFLFDQIYKCAVAHSISDENIHLFYNFGNNARKFLEIYTFYKFPSNLFSLKDSLKDFWGDELDKILNDRIHNEYSHLTQLERGTIIPNLEEMKKAASLIIEKIEESDPRQYQGLLESIGESNNDSK